MGDMSRYVYPVQRKYVVNEWSSLGPSSRSSQVTPSLIKMCYDGRLHSTCYNTVNFDTSSKLGKCSN